MSWVITAAVATGIGTVVSVKGQLDTAKAQQYELEAQADQERVASESRELQRRQQLNKALAANVVGQSMSGIAGEGTPQSIALESAKQVSISEGVESLSDRLRQAQLKRQASNVRGAGKLAAASTLLKGAQTAAQMGS